MTSLTSAPSTRTGSVVHEGGVDARMNGMSERLVDRLGKRVARGALARLTRGSVEIREDYGGETFVSGRGAGVAGVAGVAEGLPASLPSRVRVNVKSPRFYGDVAFGGSVGAAEAYMDGLWETDDLAGLIETLIVNYEAYEGLRGPVARLLAPLEWVAALATRNTRRGSRKNIHAHYDLGNDFFGLFLDRTMMYSCGIFENDATTLEQAQVEKVDRACRKLALGPRDHLLEIGTGWGYAAVHAAGTYGCRVTTTTISRRQYDAAIERVRESGVADRVTVIMEDYRDLKGSYDKLLSIEMIEAVGRENIPRFFECCSRLLAPHGAMLLQAIVIRDQYFKAAAGSIDFLKKYIFPGSCLLGVEAMQRAIAARTDMRLWHLEDIGPHYVRTLAAWRAAFIAQRERVLSLGFDERFIRMWEYYLAYCEGSFRGRHVGDVQMLLTKPMCRMEPASPRAAGLA